MQDAFNVGSHVTIGYVVGRIARFHPAASGLISWFYLQYQSMSFWRKRDQVGKDIAEGGIGLGAGLVAGEIHYRREELDKVTLAAGIGLVVVAFGIAWWRHKQTRDKLNERRTVIVDEGVPK